MAAMTRQEGRRGVNYATRSTRNINNLGGALSRSSIGLTSVPPRRYVLDVPTGRTARTSRTKGVTYKRNDGYDDWYIRSRSAEVPRQYSGILTTNINNENVNRLSRSRSREYYYRDIGNDTPVGNANYYLDNSSAKQLLESRMSYTNTEAEDQEVQALTAQATPDIKNYPINVDANPELIVRPNTQQLKYTQNIAIRYLKPNTPPPPGPIIIREIRAPQPPPAPPIILRQRPPPPRTPSPIIIREKPPSRPKSVPTTIIKKIIPPPPPPPRKLIIERLPMLPPKPRPVIIERWFPYHKQKRQVIHEKAKPLEPMARIKNSIIEWRSPEVEVVKHVKKLGVTEFDPQRYYTQYGDKLYTSEFVRRKLTELGLQEELALMQEQQVSIDKEELEMENANEYNVRQILNGYVPSSSSKHTYTNGNVMRRVDSSSHSGLVDEYGEQQILYDRSPENLTTAVYDENNYNFDRNRSNVPVLTEEMLLRSYESNNGKFPTHLLTKLGSHAYDMPFDQVDVSNNARRTATHHYTVNHSGTVAAYNDDMHTQTKAFDIKDVLANYDLYSSTGQRLEGEQINF